MEKFKNILLLSIPVVLFCLLILFIFNYRKKIEEANESVGQAAKESREVIHIKKKSKKYTPPLAVITKFADPSFEYNYMAVHKHLRKYYGDKFMERYGSFNSDGRISLENLNFIGCNGSLSAFFYTESKAEVNFYLGAKSKNDVKNLYDKFIKELQSKYGILLKKEQSLSDYTFDYHRIIINHKNMIDKLKISIWWKREPLPVEPYYSTTITFDYNFLL